MADSADAGGKRVQAVVGTGLSAGAGAAGVYAGMLAARSLDTGRAGTLAAGLGLGAVAVAAAAAAAWVFLLLLQNDSAGSGQRLQTRARIAYSVLVVLAETGLAWLLVESASRHHVALTWIAGGAALAATGLVVATWGLAGTAFDLEVLALGLGAVTAVAALGVLAAGLAARHDMLAAWLLAGLAIAQLAASMLLPDSDQLPAAADLTVVVGAGLVVPAGAVLGLLVVFAVGGNVIGAAATGAVGLAVAIIIARPLDLTSFGRRRRARSWEAVPAADSVPAPPVPALARLAGLVIPLGTIGWAVADSTPGLRGTAAARVLSVASWIALAAAALLVLQGLASRWLRPSPASGALMRWAARDARELAERERIERERFGREWAERERYERERFEREGARSRGPGPPPWPQAARRAAQEDHERRMAYERHGLHEDRVSRLRADAAGLSTPLLTRLARAIVRPVSVRAAAVLAGVDLASSTGLVVDQAWPLAELVVPADLRDEAARRDRAVAVLRAVAASAACTAVAWPVAAELVSASTGAVTLASLAAAPAVAAAAAVAAARRRLSDAYLRRVHAIEVYRFDLLTALHLPRAASDAEFIELSRFIHGPDALIRDPGSSRPVVWPERSAPSPPDAEALRDLRRELAADVLAQVERALDVHRREIHLDQARTVREQRDEFMSWLRRQALGPEELAALGGHIAEQAAGPVSERLARRIGQLQEQFAREMRGTLEELIAESAGGPPLANFTGYLTLELEPASEQDPGVSSADGAVRARPGHELAVAVSVVRNPAAARVAPLSQAPDGSFLVLEPVRIEGGRDVPVAEFDAIADCATLTPLPRRRDLSVAGQASASFRFRLPDRAGHHELWFQLYQAGRLIQAVAVLVEVVPEAAAAT